jgi:hypothetical protein
MTEPSREVRVPRFEWWRFAAVASFTWAIFLTVGFIGDGDRTNLIEMAIPGFSIVMFLGYRFHRIRTDVASGHLSHDDLSRDPRAHFLGPKLPLVLWFGFTILAPLAFILWRISKGMW